MTFRMLPHASLGLYGQYQHKLAATIGYHGFVPCWQPAGFLTTFSNRAGRGESDCNNEHPAGARIRQKTITGETSTWLLITPYELVLLSGQCVDYARNP